EIEAEAAAAEQIRLIRRDSTEQAERTGNSLVGLAIRDESVGFGGRTVVVLGKRDRRMELPWSRLNAGTPVVLSESQTKDKSGWRGIVTDRDRETISVALADSPETETERPVFRLDLSSDEVARERQRDALRYAESIDHGYQHKLKQRLLGL